eukprot:CAMPEP_0201686614 /NCGR_PEP_ID=MMETSP0578-20130828/994_1 /ASSEMBLY_ACC=CAM_ASM_000663 /TAXON_ID=267565 /ORGANISM="Skeletonema grethea, Strain CCMP 1804" /LENGTH=299 /DNA_ID=CAMNT_0048170685 /DNA_START=13 /DNA_END=912 /DNA_ORIENTATION=-
MASADTLPHNKEADDDADMFEDATDGPASSIEGGNNNTSVTDTNEKTVQKQLASNPPPAALPTGWYLKPSQINAPGNYYYFNQDTGECCWDLPASASSTSAAEAVSQESLNATALAAAAAVKSILKRAEPTAAETNTTFTSKSSADTNSTVAKSSSRKKQKTDDREKHREKHHSSSSSSPKEVRVLHILKKHKDSRRPASWRNPKITDTKQKAISDLHELLSILSESSSNPKELRATFEELAKTESDCSSAKRGGNLGFFGRKKMQPAFEKASFGLRVGELTRDVVDTSSGVHIILRLA